MQSSEETVVVETKEATEYLPSEEKTPPRNSRRQNQKQTIVIVVIVLLWTYVYNLCVKEYGTVGSFFRMLDTISDDLLLGSALIIAMGLAIVFVFSVIKLYGQIISNVYSFKILEDMWYTDMKAGRVRTYFAKLLTFDQQPTPHRSCPEHGASILFSFAFIYFMSWVDVVLFSEALFFVSWSAGVDLPITRNNMLLMPTLALAIPFSSRVMAYLRYPYAIDYADFMPAAAFVLLVVTTLGYLFESDDQKFFLHTIYQNPEYLAAFLSNGVFLAFIPVLFEAIFWLIELHHSDSESPPQLETATQTHTEKETTKHVEPSA